METACGDSASEGFYLPEGECVAAAVGLRQERQQPMCGLMGKTQEKEAELEMKERESLD